mgnify:CR=1 FL=1
MLGLSSSLGKKAVGLPLDYVRDGLKLYMPYKESSIKGTQFVGEGSTYFTTDDYVTCTGTESLLDGATEGTISAWIKNDGQQGGEQHIVSKYDSGAGERAWQLYLSSGNIVTFGAFYNNAYSGDTNIASGYEILADQWYHVVGTFSTSDSNKVRIYVNGSLQATSAASLAGSIADPTGNNVEIGRRTNSGTGSAFFYGSIKNVAIWSRALTATEVQNVTYKTYEEIPRSRLTDNLVSWWSLEDGFTTSTLSNGDFSSAASWIVKGGWEISGGTLISTSTTIPAYQQNVVTVGSIYTVTYTIDSLGLGSGDVMVKLGTTEGTPRSSVGTFTESLLCAGGTSIFFVNNDGAGFSGVIDDVSVTGVVYDKLGTNNGTPTGATANTTLYGGYTPVIPRGIDNAPTVQADAIGAGSASFNGTNNEIDLGSGATLEEVFSGGGTVMAWINPDSDGENDLGRVFDKSDSTDHSDGWSVVVSNENSGSADLRFAHSFSGSNPVWDTASREITIGSWNHIAITYDNGATGNDSIIYINGISVTLDSANPSPSGSATDDSSENLFIGNNTGGDRTFDGNICQVGIWGAVLTQAQIQSIMEKTYEELIASERANLISYWPLDTSSNLAAGSDNVKDSHGSNHGTLA